MGISIVIPAYREAENLAVLLPELQRVFQDVDHEIDIIDTMEPLDGTEDVCQKHGANYVRREGGNTYGDAVRTGFQVARKDRILMMDADGSHMPSDARRMMEGCEPFDLTIGSRYVAEGKTDNPAILIFMSKIVNVCFRIALGLKVKDISDSFRIYKAEDVKRLQLDCNNFDIVEEIIIKLALYNAPYKIREVPITFNKRMYGESKRDLVRFTFSYVQTIARLVRIKRKAMKDTKHA